MAEAKMRPTKLSAREFLNAVDDPVKRADSFTVLELMRRVTGEEPVMWGTSIVGFGKYHYQYASGHEGDAPMVGFSPRKAALTLYLSSEYEGYEELMARLGKYKLSKACLYLKRLADVDPKVLEELIRRSYIYMQSAYPIEVEG